MQAFRPIDLPRGFDRTRDALLDIRWSEEAATTGRWPAALVVPQLEQEIETLVSVSEDIGRSFREARDEAFLAANSKHRVELFESIDGAARERLTDFFLADGPVGRRLVLRIDPRTNLDACLFEAMGPDVHGGRSVVPSDAIHRGAVEVVRLVEIHQADDRPLERAGAEQRRALVIVGDLDRPQGTDGAEQDFAGEVTQLVALLRRNGVEVTLVSATGETRVAGREIEENRLLDASESEGGPSDALERGLETWLGRGPWDFVHYVGHGNEDPSLHAPQLGASATALVFRAGPTPGDSFEVPAEKLGAWMRPHGAARVFTASLCRGGPVLAKALASAAEHVFLATAKNPHALTRKWTRLLYENLLERLPEDGDRSTIGAAVCRARAGLEAPHAWIPQHYARTLNDALVGEDHVSRFLAAQASRLCALEGRLAPYFRAGIEELYVDLHLVPRSGAHLDDKDTLRSLVTLTENDAAWVTRRWLLFGEGGSGKSTTLRHLALEFTDSRSLVPVYLRLATWLANEDGTSIDPKRLREKWSEIEAQIGAGKDRLLLLLDGVDELSEVQVKLTRDLALDLAPPSARVVVSSRDSGATHIFEQQRDRGFVSVGLKELDDEQRELLVRRVAGTLSSKGAELDATAFAKELGRALPEESRVPLFVTLATWLRVARGIEVGGSGRLDFLRYCVDELLFDEHRDSTRGPVSPLFKARDAGAWFARLVALHYALVGQLPDLSGTAAGWIDSAKLDNGPLSSTWRQLDAALGLQQGLKQGDDWDDDALEEIPGIDLSVKVMRGLLAALRSSALCDGDSPLQPWSHRSLGQVLVADLILAYYAKAGLEALCTLTGEWIAHSGRESAARFAEIWAFVGLGIESSDDRDEWILFLAAQEKQSDLGGRAVTRGLSMGVQVRPRVAATALGVEGDWRRRHKAYGSFEPLDSEQLQELLTSLVLQVDLEQTGDETLDRRDLGWALERARAGWNGRASTRAQTAIETLIIDRLPSPDLERMRAAFGTIGGAWAETDEEQERLAEDRSMLAPLRDDPEHPVDAAPLDAPFWVDVEGTTDDEPFAIGADSDDEDAFENETPPPGGVHLSSYAISAVPVTRGLYRLFDPTHERNAQGRADEPATDLIWYEARLFCAWATHWLRHFKLLAPDEAIDLPTEAQWEFAARECGRSKGGSRFHTGRDEEDLARAGWHYGHHYLPEGPRTMPVGLLIPATIKGPDEPKIQRLWDCHGNVFEWCRDIYADELEGGEDPAGPAWQPGRGADRVVRCGSVDFVARLCRASCRFRLDPAFDFFDFDGGGFRLVRAPSV